MAWCGAGDEPIRFVCEKIREGLETKTVSLDEMEGFLREAGTKAWNECFSSTQPRDRIQVNRRLLVAKTDTAITRAWWIELYQTCIPSPVHDKWVIGDSANLCRFLTERYYLPKLPVERLKLLAAATVLFGAHLNSLVRGLEMVIGQNGIIEAVREDELARLTSKVSEADSIISRALLGC